MLSQARRFSAVAKPKIQQNSILRNFLQGLGSVSEPKKLKKSDLRNFSCSRAKSQNLKMKK